MKVAIVFDPDDSLGSDPLDEANQPRSLGIFLDSDKTDVLLMFKEYGEAFEGGSRTHIFPSGIWENVDPDRVEEAIDHITELPND